MVDVETLKELRQKLPDTPFVMWYCDPLFESMRMCLMFLCLSQRSELVDVIFTTSGAMY